MKFGVKRVPAASGELGSGKNRVFWVYLERGLQKTISCVRRGTRARNVPRVNHYQLSLRLSQAFPVGPNSVEKVHSRGLVVLPLSHNVQIGLIASWLGSVIFKSWNELSQDTLNCLL